MYIYICLYIHIYHLCLFPAFWILPYTGGQLHGYRGVCVLYTTYTNCMNIRYPCMLCIRIGIFREKEDA